MAILGSYRRIYKQDYSPNIQKDIDTLSISLNQSFDTVYNALTNQITFADNINCTIQTFTTSVNSSNVPTSPIVLKLNSFQKNVIGIIPINVIGNNKNIFPTGGVYINYTLNNNTTSSSNSTNTGNAASSAITLNINNITGIPQNVPFKFTIIII